ncbi:hypothetical protein J4H92_08910 [Leucobacter weissii]|uniref:Uncharacterized protein n=1 Tax=Leucobacter weissii TaxID=1983706 RepID=A0A939S671_9MICO|nr:hypothetical protein [Leucobacter weissii]MBO1902064.1 hypothetical protein [Leucobacter weissii]
MGIFRDLGTLIKAGAAQSLNTDYAESIRESAKLAEQYLENGQPGSPGSRGAASGNPFENLQAYQSGIPASGQVVSLTPTERRVDDVTVYAVELEITIDGLPSYRTIYQTVIAAAALPNWQPGKILPFRVMKDNPRSLLLG